MPITLKEAIREQTELLGWLPQLGCGQYLASTLVGIEAMKRVKANRVSGIVRVYKELPGESED